MDLEKAYDRISWSFLKQTLEFFQFPAGWIKLIMNCVSSTQFSVLINGEASDFFSPARGVRQGDPLSPYLFVLCMERLSGMIEDKVNSGSWLEVKARRSCPSISICSSQMIWSSLPKLLWTILWTAWTLSVLLRAKASTEANRNSSSLQMWELAALEISPESHQGYLSFYCWESSIRIGWLE